MFDFDAYLRYLGIVDLFRSGKVSFPAMFLDGKNNSVIWILCGKFLVTTIKVLFNLGRKFINRLFSRENSLVMDTSGIAFGDVDNLSALTNRNLCFE